MKRYYMDITTDVGYVVAENEEEAYNKMRDFINKTGYELEIYDTEDPEADEINKAREQVDD